MMDLLAIVADLAANAVILAKELAKGGGGGGEEPTVCMVLLPFAAGLAYAVVHDLRERRQRVRRVAG